jgi:hypothetical protein
LCVAALLGMGSAGCGADDNSNVPPPQPDASTADSGSGGNTPKDAAPDVTMPPPTGTASVQLSATSLDFSMALCEAQNGTAQQLTVTNNGTGTLAVAAKVTGAAFTLSPTSLSVAPGMTGVITVTANIVSTAAAGMMVSGSLSLFTNDPTRGTVTIPLSATATGATLTLQPGDPTTFAFPTTAVGATSAPITMHLVNSGNAPATFTLTPPSDPEFVISALAGEGGAGMLLNPNDLIAVTATFQPTSAAMITGTAAISTTNPTCGTSFSALSFTGQGGKGTVNGWPTAPIDFGNVECGGMAPPPQSFTLTNSGPADALITTVSTLPMGWTTSAKPGRAIFAGGQLAITVTAPAVLANSQTTPITATLSIGTDADSPNSPPHTITLTEEPSGAVLGFQAPQVLGFGPVVLLKSTTQDFKITNSGTASANVTLTVVQDSTDDGGAGEGGSPGGVSPFVLTTPSFGVNGPGEQDETVVFTPQTAQAVTGSIHMTATGAICGALPSDIPLAGSGLGGGPTVVPTSVALTATCGGAAPTAQTFLVRNDGTADFTWNLTLGTGVLLSGASPTPDAGPPLYTISANPAPGLLHPGDSSIVTVNGTQIPMYGANPNLSAYAAQVTITTDVPLDPPHVVSITETPLGDQITMTGPTPLRFGQIPIGTTIPQTLLVTNYATAGSPAANLTFSITSTEDGGASAYSVVPPTTANLASGVGASARETVTFAPTAAMPYDATLSIVTDDKVCTPLPAPIPISGTGTNGLVAVSTQSIAFGTDTTDTIAGLVNCGAQGPAHTFTVTNRGNQAFNITGLALGLGSASPYQVSGATLPAALAIGDSVTLTVTPGAIPQNVADPADPTPFKDTLTITTDATGDTPHTVSLLMQARGAVIKDTPITTNWPFGTISFGSIGTFPNSISNSGNSGVTIRIAGLSYPRIFGLQSAATKVPGATTPTSVVGTFTPSASDGTWSDKGQLVVTADQALCEPLPMQWNSPMVTMSGASDSTPAVTYSGSLVFPTTECGNSAPPAQTITLTNASNVAYPYTLSFSSGGKFYSTTPTEDAGGPDGGAGTVPASGSAQILVTPHTVTPGPSVLAGSTPYADELLVTVETNPPTQFAIPISWSLSGAVLSLPPGFTRTDKATNQIYYPADSTGALALPLLNTGTEPVSITYSSQPTGAFSISPMPPIVINPGTSTSAPTALSLVAGSTDPSCTASPFAPTVGSASLFIVSGAVCQPLPGPVVVESCSGTFPSP